MAEPIKLEVIDKPLSDEEIKEILKTIPKETLEYYGVDFVGEEPVIARINSVETRMTRKGYTITDRADYYDFNHGKWSSRGGKRPSRIIPHHMAGNLTVKQFQAIIYSTSRQMSSTVSIHTDGTVYAWVPEEFRPWTTSSYEADQVALTMEIANDQIGGNWHISDKAYNLAVRIAAEWCKRYGITPSYKAGRKGTIQMHKEWANTACPGPYLENKIVSGQFTKDINAILNPPKPTPTTKTIYRVQNGAFKEKKKAFDLQQKIIKAGFEAILKPEDGWTKVQSGAFENKANADALVAKLRKAGLPAVVITATVKK